MEEYIQYELTADCRHEYINGKRFKMSGEKDINNDIAFEIGVLLRPLKAKEFSIHIESVKVAIPGGSKFYYPDVFITKEPRSANNRYIKYEPELIIEVLSPSTYNTDTVDKYIAYTTIPSLNYYLLVEPETVYVVVYSKTAENQWEAMTYTQSTDAILLPLLGLDLPLRDVYPQ